MSKSGQNNFTGINSQADLALLYLLENYKKNNFIKITLEGKNWEDFTLHFSNKVESFEVKWHRSLTASLTKSIIKKELSKNATGYEFKILCKVMSKEFKKNYEYLKNSLRYWHLFNKTLPFSENKILQDFFKKGWTEEEVFFLIKTDIIEFDSSSNIISRINDHFLSQEIFYLEGTDLDSIIALTFREILQKSAQGKVITKSQFEKKYNSFIKEITDKSESFNPSVTLGNSQFNIEKFLGSVTEFKKLNSKKYLTAITYRVRLIGYMSEKLIGNDFSANEIDFFIEKILIKQSYLYTCLRLLKAKNEKKLLNAEYYIDFLVSNYKYFKNDYIVYGFLEILDDILKKNNEVSGKDRVLRFLKSQILIPFNENRYSNKTDLDYEYKFKYLPSIIENIGESLKDSEEFLDLLFEYFDFTGDAYPGIIVTPGNFYNWIKNYILLNVDKNFSKVINKIGRQYQIFFGEKYYGCEFIGRGVEMSNNIFSISDIGIVRYLFLPLFYELEDRNPKKLTKILNKFVLIWYKEEASLSCPIYLKRAALPILVKRIITKPKNSRIFRNAFSHIKRILKLTKGHPDTSEVLFSNLRDLEIGVIEPGKIIELIKLDSIKYGQDKMPSNIFVMETLLKLSNSDFKAKSTLIDLLVKEEFRKTNIFQDFLRTLGNETYGPKFLELNCELLAAVNLPHYLQQCNDPYWIDSAALSNIIRLLIQKGDGEKARNIIESFILGLHNSDISKNFIGNVIEKLSNEFPKEIFHLLEPALKNQNLFKKSDENTNLKTSLLSLGEKLIKAAQFSNAKLICDLLRKDPNPITSNEEGENNYHLKIKKGGEEIIITTVRGRCCWLIQKFVLSEQPSLMEYALACTKELLDLDETLAKKLGYVENDYYVLTQALVPLAELSRPERRKLLNESKLGMGDSVRNLVFQVMTWLEKSVSNGNNPKDAIKNLLYSFSYIRDLDERFSKRLINLLESQEITEGAFLFIYFSFYREKEKSYPIFDSTYFQKKLKELCERQNPLRRALAWEFWKNLAYEKDSISEDIAIPYWKALANDYQEEVYTYLEMILENRLENGQNYVLYKEILFNVLENEIGAIKDRKIFAPKIGFDKIGPLVFENNVTDFLELLNKILHISDFSQGTNPYDGHISDMANIFSSIDEFKLSKKGFKLFKIIEKQFLDLGRRIKR